MPFSVRLDVKDANCTPIWEMYMNMYLQLLLKKNDKGNNQQAGAAAAVEVVVVLFSFATLFGQPNRKYFCCKYKETKLHNDKWREPPAIEFIISLRVTAKAWKYKGYMQKIRYRALRIARFKIISAISKICWEKKLTKQIESDHFKKVMQKYNNKQISNHE